MIKHAPARLLFLILMLSSGLHAAMADSLTHLSPGVLIDADRAEAWIADSSGYARAIELGTGGSRWRSADQAFPLTILDGQLLALGHASQTGLGVLLMLDVESGRTVERMEFGLPELVIANARHSTSGQFEVSVERLDQVVRLHWRFLSRPFRGARATDPAAESSPASRSLSGAVDIARVDSRTLVQAADQAHAPAPVILELVGDLRSTTVSGRQFRAASGAEILSSERIEASGAFPYRWNLHRPDGARLGSLRASSSRADFVVYGDVVFYRARPLAFRNADAEWANMPERLVCYDLQGGIERWSIAILDRAFKGPLPP